MPQMSCYQIIILIDTSKNVFMNKSIKTLMAIIFVSLVASCVNIKKEDAEKNVNKWIGKTIIFPPNIHPIKLTLKNDCSKNQACNTNFKILLYADSTGCTSCKLRLSDWKFIMQEANVNFPDKLSFIFYLQPKFKGNAELINTIKNYNLGGTIYVDDLNSINSLNKFSPKPEFQCFLLDINNKVMGLGNPVKNPNIWNLYKSIISVHKCNNKELSTRVKVETDKVKLKNLNVKYSAETEFKIKNIGNNPLVIHNVISACDCVVPSWEKKAIDPGNSTIIKIKIRKKNIGYFKKTINVYCNIEKEILQLNIIGDFK